MTYYFETEPSYSIREQLESLIANETKFIAVFGTSHSKGVCHNRENTYNRILPEHTWVGIVQDNLNIPIVNFSTPAVQNDVLIQQILDFVQIEGVKQFCKYVILEPRSGYPYDRIYADNYSQTCVHDIIKHNTFLYRTHNVSWLDTISYITIPTETIDVVRDRFEQYYSVVYGSDYPEHMIQHVADLTKNMNARGLKPIIEDKLHVRTAVSILNLVGIKCKYFYWQRFNTDGIEDYYTKVSILLNNLYDIDRQRFKAITNESVEGHTTESGLWMNREDECACGHAGATIHRLVAEALIPEIRIDIGLDKDT